jgi:hypothetical protein
MSIGLRSRAIQQGYLWEHENGRIHTRFATVNSLRLGF